VLNRVSHSVNIVKSGRPRKEYTGKRGRPPKVKSTKKAQIAAKANKLGRKAQVAAKKAQIAAKANKLGRKAQVAANAIVPDADDTTTEDELNGDGITDADDTTAEDELNGDGITDADDTTAAEDELNGDGITDADDTTVEDELNGDGITDADTPTDIDTDTEIETNVNVPPQNPVTVEDPNDNAGDADAAGDGSACLEDKFIEYDNPEDDGVIFGTTLEVSQTQLAVSIYSKSISKKPTVLGMPIEDLVSVFVSAQLASKLTE
jgi:hypothetical protein